MKTFIKLALSVMGIILITFALVGPAFAGPEVRVTLCHATSDESNPYNKVTVSGNSVENKANWLNGHGGHVRDIWPAFTLADGTPVAAQGDQSILANDCVVPEPPTNTPVPPPTNTPIPPPTNTPRPTNTPVPPRPTDTVPPGNPTSTPGATNTPVPLPTNTPQQPSASPTPGEQNTAGGSSSPIFGLLGLIGAALLAAGIIIPKKALKK